MVAIFYNLVKLWHSDDEQFTSVKDSIDKRVACMERFAESAKCHNKRVRSLDILNMETFDMSQLK